MGKTIDDNDQSDTAKSSKGWLQSLKDESWEAELLVSTVSIFGTFQLFYLIGWATDIFIDLLDPSQYHIAYIIVFFGLFAISILSSMFVIHFFLRAYWIGLVGLNSVFPDYSIEDSAYSKAYTEKILSILPKSKDSIQKVDELCSVIFSVAFTFLLIYMYLALFSSVYLLIFNSLSDYVSYYILLIPAILLLIITLIQMVFSIIGNLKSNKEKQKLQIWSYKITRLTSLIMYGPLYKSILQVSMIFGSNFKKKKNLVYLIILFVFSGIFVSIYQTNKTNILYLINHKAYFDTTRTYSSYYASENEHNNLLLTPQIESDKIESSVLKLFIPVFGHEKKIRKKVCGSPVKDPNKSNLEQRKERRTHLLDCYHQYNFVFINGEKIKVDYLGYQHPKTDQSGIISYIPLSNIKMGMNKLVVKKENGAQDVSEWTIPFYYTPN